MDQWTLKSNKPWPADLLAMYDLSFRRLINKHGTGRTFPNLQIKSVMVPIKNIGCDGRAHQFPEYWAGRLYPTSGITAHLDAAAIMHMAQIIEKKDLKNVPCTISCNPSRIALLDPAGIVVAWLKNNS